MISTRAFVTLKLRSCFAAASISFVALVPLRRMSSPPSRTRGAVIGTRVRSALTARAVTASRTGPRFQSSARARSTSTLSSSRSQAPQGERLDQYVAREERGEPHIGETPLDIADNVDAHARNAERAIERARPHVLRNGEEFERIATDVKAIALMTRAYTFKARAAIPILTYKLRAGREFLNHVELLEQAIPDFEQSLKNYRKLAELTEYTYLYANSMQTPQRKVPFPDGERHGHWRDCLPYYEQEFDHFTARVGELKRGQLPAVAQEEMTGPYAEAEFVLHSADAEKYVVDKQSRVFSDGDVIASHVADELAGLTGIRINRDQASKEGVQIDIELKEPARIRVGYFNSKDSEWLQVPNLEENTHADDRGGLSPILKNGLKVFFYPSVNVHAFMYEPGRHTLVFGQGSYLIAGMIKASQKITVRDLEGSSSLDTLDWLYENGKA